MATKTVADAVCPVCFKPLPDPTVFECAKDECGRELRTYFGFCFECNIGYEVIQFLRQTPAKDMQGQAFGGSPPPNDCGGRWIIHKYQAYKYIGVSTECEKFGKWVILNDLPEPAPVVIGPGGDFNKPVEINQFELLKKMRKILQSLCQSIDCMIKGFK